MNYTELTLNFKTNIHFHMPRRWYSDMKEIWKKDDRLIKYSFPVIPESVDWKHDNYYGYFSINTEFLYNKSHTVEFHELLHEYDELEWFLFVWIIFNPWKDDPPPCQVH